MIYQAIDGFSNVHLEPGGYVAEFVSGLAYRVWIGLLRIVS
jgi:hypothetical protein